MLLNFYLETLNINGKSIRDFIKFSDLELCENLKFISFLFPCPSKINVSDEEVLICDKMIRRKIIRLVLRLVRFYGFSVDSDTGKMTGVNRYLLSSDLKIIEQMSIFTMHIKMYKISNILKSIISKTFHKETFTGLTNINNSCYMDSILVALFSCPNKIIYKNILKKDLNAISGSKKQWITAGSDEYTDFKNRKQIQDELIRITNSFRGFEGVKNCTRLRKYLSNCKGSQEFHRGGMQDAGEFLLYLLNIFEVEIMSKHRVTYVTNSLAFPPKAVIKTFEEIQKCTPVINISNFKLKPNINVCDFLQESEDALFNVEDFYKDEKTGHRYRRRIENVKVISSSYIVFNIQRLGYDDMNRERYLDVPIKFPEIILDKLFLLSIVVHRNSHYTCYVKINEEWYYYDDMEDPLVIRVESIASDVYRNCTLLFYG
jgi:hypothetical protein